MLDAARRPGAPSRGSRRGSCAWSRARPPRAGSGPPCGRSRWRPWRTGTPPRCSRCRAGTRRPPSRARTGGRAASRGGRASGWVEASAGDWRGSASVCQCMHRAEERRRLVVEVVAGGHHRVAVLERGAVHQVALGEAAGRAGRAPRGLLDHRECGAPTASATRSMMQRLAARGGERLALGLGLDRVVEDAEVEIEPGGLVARPRSARPRARASPCRRRRPPDRLVAREHLVLADRLGDLLAEELEEVRASRRRRCGAAARGRRRRRTCGTSRRPARAPPDMTGRTSSTSSSPTTLSAVRSSSPRMTSTVLGQDVELDEELLDPALAVHLDSLAADCAG